MSHIAVVDLGAGNLHSVGKALERVAPRRSIEITNSPKTIRDAGHVVLPGQGAIGSWFRVLDRYGLRDIIANALTIKPILGICLGLQSLYEFSEEDNGTDGFGIMVGDVKRFPIAHHEDGKRLKVPHMGWNNVCQKGNHPLWRNIANDSRFYFVHSYYADSNESSQIAGMTSHGFSFISAAARSNVFAVQFHPEKSHRQGLMLLHNFVQWDGSV